MKQFVQQFSPLSIVSSGSELVDLCLDEDEAILSNPFDGCLNSVRPILFYEKTLRDESTILSYGQPPLTSTDEIHVNRATVRESNAHRHWPRYVVERFIAAEVITRK